MYEHATFYRLAIGLCLLLALTGCASKGTYVLELMPAPDVFDEGVIDPFRDAPDPPLAPELTVLYATDRRPETDEGKATYTSERGHVVRLGQVWARTLFDGLFVTIIRGL